MEFDARDQLQALAALPPEPPKPAASKTSAWSAPFRALPAGVAEVGAMLAESVKGFGQALDATGTAGAGGMFGGQTDAERAQSERMREQIRTRGLQGGSEVSRSLRNVAEGYGPDPLTASKAEQIVFGLTKGVSKAIGYGLTTGPAAPLLFGLDEGLTETDRLQRQGVDDMTAGRVGMVVAGVNAAGLALPVAGRTAAQTFGLATAGGPASFVAQQVASREILTRADYHDIAATFDPLDPWGLALSSLPYGFGAWAMRARMRGVPDRAPARDQAPADGAAGVADTRPMPEPARPVEAPPMERTPVAQAVQEAMPREAVDAAMVHNLTEFEAGARANPPEKFEAELWRGAVTENPSFKTWFGESQMVNKAGAPLILYHGTDRAFDQFDPGSLQAYGIHLTADPALASRYATSRSMDGGRGANVVPVYVRAARVKDVEFISTDSIQQAQAEGFDAVRRGDHVVVMRPEQIKSAIGNSGRFDPTSASLTDPIPAQPKGTATDAPTTQELGAQAREAPSPQAQAQATAVAAIEPGSGPDAALIESVRSRGEQVVREAPDLVVGMTEDGQPITAREALERIRQEAQAGTDDTLGAADAPLLDVAVSCALSLG